MRNLFFLLNAINLTQLLFVLLHYSKINRIWRTISRYHILRELRGGLYVKNRQVCFNDYKKLFINNNIDLESGTWDFNYNKYHIDDILRGNFDKYDYTLGIILCHMEWVFSFKNFNEDIIDKLFHFVEKYKYDAHFKQSTACNQRIYSLIYIHQMCDSRLIKELLEKEIQTLILNTEEHVWGNHVIDNYLALLFAARIYHLDDLQCFCEHKLLYFIKPIVLQGYYPEMNPVYQGVLYEKFKLLLHVSDHQSAYYPVLLKMADLLIQYPNVVMNDCYLPLSVLPLGNSEACPYAHSLKVADCVATVVKDYLPNKNFRAHYHDCSGALFLYRRGLPVIVGPGTGSYAAGVERDILRSGIWYPKPRLTQNEQFVLQPYGSFRFTTFPNKRTRHTLISSSIYDGRHELKFQSGDLSYTWRFLENDAIIELIPNTEITFRFYSAFSRDSLIQDYSLEVEGSWDYESSTIFDGLNNSMSGYRHEIRTTSFRIRL